MDCRVDLLCSMHDEQITDHYIYAHMYALHGPKLMVVVSSNSMRQQWQCSIAQVGCRALGSYVMARWMSHISTLAYMHGSHSALAVVLEYAAC